jgi:BirA family biotin operon repressor/biotin-[acetyl-CoA-carboxylase] ligase
MSTLLRPKVASGLLGLLPLAAGVAVAEALGEGGVEAQLKWPNDVLVDGRKIAGILAEGSSGSRGADWVVLGLGINLVPPEGLQESATATSLLEEGRPLDRLTLAAGVLRQLSAWYHALVDPQAVLERWRALSAPWWGRMVEVRSGTQRVEGLARDVDARGALLLEVADGSLAAIVSGEARELRLRSE